MLTSILVLVLSVACCNGQRRWAGSYSGEYAPEDKVTWDNRNYPRRDIEVSTEVNVEYRGKWPADKGNNAFDVSSSRDSRARGVEHGARRDDRTGVEIRQEKGIYQTPPRERRIQPASDEFNAREGGRPVVISERDRLKNNRKEEFPIVDEGYNSRQNTRDYKGDVGKANEELPPQDGSHRRRPLPPNDRYGNREENSRYGSEEENKNYRSYEERPDDSRPPLRDYDTRRDEIKAASHEAGKDGGPRRDNKDKFKNKSENDNVDEMTSYQTGESRHGSPKIEESQNPGRGINNKGDMGAMPREIPNSRRQEWNHPREDYGDKQTGGNVNYKGYGGEPGRYRPKDSEEQLTAREYIRGKGQPQIPGDLQSKGDRKVSKEDYEIEVTNTGRYNRSMVKASGEEHFTPTYTKGHVYHDGNDDERITAREFDRRMEEEMKRKEYERRLEEEEMKKRQEETKNFRPVVVTGRQEDVIRDYRSGREDRPAGGRRHNAEKGIPRRHQEDRSDKEYGNQGRTTKAETNERNFGTRRDNDWRKGVSVEGQIDPIYSRREEERRHEQVKGDFYITREGRVTARTEIVRDSMEQAKVQNSKGTQGERTEGQVYNGKVKGESYNRESDYTVKRMHYNQSSSQSRVYRNDGQRTADSTVTRDDPVATTENGYHRRKSSNGNRMPEHSIAQSTSNPLRDIEGSGRNQRSEERSKHDSSNQRSDTDPREKSIYDRSSEESADKGFKSMEANDRHGRRTYSRATIPPPYNKERAKRKSDESGSDNRYSRPVYRATSVSTYLNRSDEQPIRNSSWRQESADKWKTSNPREVYGYHPNVSYDTIVFLDYEDGDETDIWNLSDQKTKESDHALNVNQSEYRRETSRLTPSARENQRRRQHRRNTASRETDFRKRNRRASIDYLARETTIQVGQSQTEDPDYIHPDVELLPGYTTAKQLGQRNHNDHVLDSEVEVFSEKEIRVSATDYKRFGGITVNRTATDERQSSET